MELFFFKNCTNLSSATMYAAVLWKRLRRCTRRDFSRTKSPGSGSAATGAASTTTTFRTTLTARKRTVGPGWFTPTSPKCSQTYVSQTPVQRESNAISSNQLGYECPHPNLSLILYQAPWCDYRSRSIAIIYGKQFLWLGTR